MIKVCVKHTLDYDIIFNPYSCQSYNIVTCIYPATKLCDEVVDRLQHDAYLCNVRVIYFINIL